jgi:hypothetical protein
MPEQVSLTEYGVVTTAVAQETTSGRDWNPGELKTLIVKLEPAFYGHCRKLAIALGIATSEISESPSCFSVYSLCRMSWKRTLEHLLLSLEVLKP